MNNKLLAMCVLSCAALAVNACDKGEFSDLDCDETYVAECLSDNMYMKCNYDAEGTAAGNGKLIAVECAPLMFCYEDYDDDGTKTAARCVDESSIANACTESICASDTVLRECVDGILQPRLCSGDTPVCGLDANNKYACISGKSDARETCEATVCDAQTNTLKVCEDGVVTRTESCGQDEVCGIEKDSSGNDAAACVAKPETCEATVCDAQTNTLKVCEDGVVTRTESCGQDKVCGIEKDSSGNEAAACVAKTDMCVADVCENGKIKVCDTQNGNYAAAADCDAGKQCFAVSGGEGEQATIVYKCAETCTADVCEDSANIRMCVKAQDAAMGYLAEATACAPTGDGQNAASVCDAGACKDVQAEDFVGAPCECKGDGCDAVYDVGYLKSLFSTAGTEWLENIADEDAQLTDGDVMTGANYFAASSCDALAQKLGVDADTEATGLKIGCFRDTTITFPSAMAEILSTQFAKKIKGSVCPNGDGDPKCSGEGEAKSVFDIIAENLNKVGRLLADGIPFKAPQGYCTVGALKLDATLPAELEGTPVDIFKTTAFSADPGAENNSLFTGFNGGDPSKIKTSDAKCPAGSVLYQYAIKKNFSSSFGKVTLDYALCLKTCDTDDDCRTGYDCATLTDVSYVGEETEAANRKKVCFPQVNHTYMEETLKPAINGFMQSLFN